MARLIACPACAAHVMAREPKCPHCGAKVKTESGAVLGRTAGAVLMGLSLAGCPAEDDDSTTTNGNGSTTMNGSTSVDPSNGSTANEVTSGGFDSSGPVGEAYGVPDTSTSDDTQGDTGSTSGSGSGSGSDSGSDSGGTDAASTGISPDYGVPTSG